MCDSPFNFIKLISIVYIRIVIYTRKYALSNIGYITVYSEMVNPSNLLSAQSTPLPVCDTDEDLADKFVNFFTDKVKKIRKSLDDCVTNNQCITNHVISIDQCPHELSTFAAVDQTYLLKLIKSAKTKTCMIDPIPTRILKDTAVLEALLPFLTLIVNSSLSSGTMPDDMKTALVVPLLKKQGLNTDTLSNYRPVSNLQFIGKIIEKCVANQLCQHISTYKLGDELQSAYKAAHSTETALLKVKRDCDNALDSGKAMLLVMLDLSAAFDTIDHAILLDRLCRFVGVKGSVLQWFESYLTGRSQQVLINNCTSKQVPLDVGVPQGSVLGPLLFLAYIVPLQHIINDHGVLHHGYADDTQLYLEFDPKDDMGLTSAIETLENCFQVARH